MNLIDYLFFYRIKFWYFEIKFWIWNYMVYFEILNIENKIKNLNIVEFVLINKK